MLRIVGSTVYLKDIPALIEQALLEHRGVNTLLITVARPERANMTYSVYSDTRELHGGQLVERT